MHWDLNPELSDYKSDARPVELCVLCAHLIAARFIGEVMLKMGGNGGIEPLIV